MSTTIQIYCRKCGVYSSMYEYSTVLQTRVLFVRCCGWWVRNRGGCRGAMPVGGKHPGDCRSAPSLIELSFKLVVRCCCCRHTYTYNPAQPCSFPPVGGVPDARCFQPFPRSAYKSQSRDKASSCTPMSTASRSASPIHLLWWLTDPNQARDRGGDCSDGRPHLG